MLSILSSCTELTHFIISTFAVNDATPPDGDGAYMKESRIYDNRRAIINRGCIQDVSLKGV